MAIVKTTPASETLFARMRDLHRQIESRAFNLFEAGNSDALANWFNAESSLLHPMPVEISEEDGTVDVKAEIPGFKKDELQVSVEGRRLIIRAAHDDKKEEKTERENGRRVVYTERRHEAFRQLVLPAEVDPDSAKATLSEGILHLHLLKRPGTERKKIDVK